MKLPPSLQEFVDSGYTDIVVHAVAHEACRLQREAQLAANPAWSVAPLVVPSTEDPA